MIREGGASVVFGERWRGSNGAMSPPELCCPYLDGAGRLPSFLLSFFPSFLLCEFSGFAVDPQFVFCLLFGVVPHPGRCCC